MNPPPVASLSESSQTQARLLEFTKALEDGADNHLIEMLRGLPPADSAHLLESSRPKTRQIIWSKKLVGRITIDDVVDVIIDEADHSMLGLAGFDEEDDTFAPIFKTMRRRTFWLGTNLITAFIASAVINLFEEAIAKVVALAVLMPIVASMEELPECRR